jgi:hypothetical protein
MRAQLYKQAAVTLGLGLVLLTPYLAEAANISHLGTDQKVLIICVKWDDFPTPRVATCDDWVALLQSEIGTFYDQSTYTQSTFDFDTPTGGPSDGWFSLGYSTSDYDFFKTGQDAINLADPHVDFSQYHRVAVITSCANFGGQGIPPVWWETDEGIEGTFIKDGDSVDGRIMSLSIVNE